MRIDFQLQGEVEQGVRKALEEMGVHHAGKIWVEASDGMVVLNGMVKTMQERDRAAQAAYELIGVRAVFNDIRVAA